VIGRLLGCDLRSAPEIVDALVSARLRQCESIATHKLDPLPDDLGLDARSRANVLAFVDEQRDWSRARMPGRRRPGATPPSRGWATPRRASPPGRRDGSSPRSPRERLAPRTD
jgi:hypothetical protein